jgi:hypothetical protein
MTINMPRGDIRVVPFVVKDSEGNPSEIQFTEIYFTVKRNYHDQEYILQKRLSTGEIETDGLGTFWFTINASDTDGLSFGKYVFDIELVADGIKQTSTGDLVLTYEATYRSNE